MVILESVHHCPKCNDTLTWDSVAKTLKCKCGVTKSTFVNLCNFTEQ
jgi:hypothetical protein